MAGGALIQDVRAALKAPFADPVTVRGQEMPRRLARWLERELWLSRNDFPAQSFGSQLPLGARDTGRGGASVSRPVPAFSKVANPHDGGTLTHERAENHDASN